MNYRIMTEHDIPVAIQLYMDYYNGHEDGEWTEDTTYKRIHQVWSREDAYCRVLEENGAMLGFAMGYMEQYDDLVAYDLIEIVVAHAHQNKGIGTAFLLELERQVKAAGASMVQLEAVNDAMHEHYYSKLGYRSARNLVPKFKFLD